MEEVSVRKGGEAMSRLLEVVHPKFDVNEYRASAIDVGTVDRASAQLHLELFPPTFSRREQTERLALNASCPTGRAVSALYYHPRAFSRFDRGRPCPRSPPLLRWRDRAENCWQRQRGQETTGAGLRRVVRCSGETTGRTDKKMEGGKGSRAALSILRLLDSP